ncbi:MAG TPA: O-antigen ligase family protein, partial [Terriglobales bacterium]|nr:O-antigen ligase family protein [Terriglobales bacterium]
MSSAVAVAPTVEGKSAQKTRPEHLQVAAFVGVFGLLLFGPLAFGAVESWAIFTLEAGSISVLALWAIGQAIRGELHVTRSSVFWPMLAFGGVVLFQLAFHQTAYRAATVANLLLYGSYGLLCFLLVQSLRRSWQLKTLLAGFSLYGFVLATFALIQGIISNGKLYWIRTPRLGGWIYGPYVNHNHYAGLIEMLTPFALVMFLSPCVRRQHNAMAALAGGMMVSTIFISGSRGGMLAFAVQMAVLAAFLISRNSSGKMALAVGAFFLFAFGLLAWLGSKELVNRMTSIPVDVRTELSGGTRLSIDRDCLRMFLHKPLTGWGLGTFPEVYPRFRSFYTTSFVDKVHNDYLQFLVETGAIGFLVMIWFLLAVWQAAIQKLKFWPTDHKTDLALAATLGMSGILAHSLVDFNLQIPANAALFF